MSVDFTIVTPSYNYGKYIGECLASVAEQEGVTYEHLVYDAGSEDDTARVVGEFEGVTFVEESDRGMCDAINKGFRAAKGRWVMWLNADDRLKSGALRAVLDHAEKDEEADVIYGGWDFVDGEGLVVREMTIFPFQKRMLCYLGCYLGSTATFYRNETVLEKGHLLDEDFRYIMDGEYYNRLADLGMRFSYLHARLADFRQHGGNLSLRNRGGESGISDELKLQKQYAETIAIRRFYGWQGVQSAPWVWFFDGLAFGYYQLKKFFCKRLYRLLRREVLLNGKGDFN